MLGAGNNISPYMLSYKTYGDRGPLLIMLHWLGGSAKTWTEVSEMLSIKGVKCIALDLPGFGGEADHCCDNTAETVAAVISTIQALRAANQGPWLLAGHSMGGKFAGIVARAALEQRPGLEDLRGIVLVSPSPPGPEPMTEDVRDKNIASLGQSAQRAEIDRKHAEAFVDDNTGKLPLSWTIRNRAVHDLLRMNRAAFVSWLTTGSREDWGSRVGTIPLPTLVVTGTDEAALGPSAQEQFTLPHFPQASLSPLEGGGHLAPLERPAELAYRIEDFIQRLGIELPKTTLSPDFQKLTESDLTSPQTRAVLMQRLADDHLKTPGILSEQERLTLSAIASRILPGCPFNLAARIDRWLALPLHDGWRNDTLPPDADAWQAGLQTLRANAMREYSVPFVALDPDRQDQLLSLAADGKLERSLLGSMHLGAESQDFTAAQMRVWFGDLRTELIRIYVADPRTMQRMAFTGFADERGFTQIRLGEREDFER